jgi:hypothetical protein
VIGSLTETFSGSIILVSKSGISISINYFPKFLRGLIFSRKVPASVVSFLVFLGIFVTLNKVKKSYIIIVLICLF